MVDRGDRIDAYEAEQNHQVPGPVDFSTAFIHAYSAYRADMLRLQVSARKHMDLRCHKRGVTELLQLGHLTVE